MLSALRREALTLLRDCGASRPPALRRARPDTHLLATDLPRCAPPEAAARAREKLEGAGWTVDEKDGWLLLDHPLNPPSFFSTQPTGEAACCLSLLARHPGEAVDPVWARRLAKAGEAGEVEKLCEKLHRELAALLRRRQPLPGGLYAHVRAACESAGRRTSHARFNR
ncbi:MAG: hypothetical protein IKP40_12930 [Clostridia bacterium]|nr:hypothetical protein [Clostridia bacterium]